MKINNFLTATTTVVGVALITVGAANAASISPKIPAVNVYVQEMDIAYPMDPISTPFQPGSSADPNGPTAYNPGWNALNCSGSISCTGGPITPPTCTVTITCGSTIYDDRYTASAVNPKPWLEYENYVYQMAPEGGPVVSPYDPGQGGPLEIYAEDDFGTIASSGRPVGMPHPRPRGG